MRQIRQISVEGMGMGVGRIGLNGLRRPPARVVIALLGKRGPGLAIGVHALFIVGVHKA
jgi:hypothetical protein